MPCKNHCVPHWGSHLCRRGAGEPTFTRRQGALHKVGMGQGDPGPRRHKWTLSSHCHWCGRSPSSKTHQAFEKPPRSLGTVGSRRGLDGQVDNLGRELQGRRQGTPRGISPRKQIDRSSFQVGFSDAYHHWAARSWSGVEEVRGFGNPW